MRLNTILNLCIGVLVLGLMSCGKNEPMDTSGAFQLEITDAPIDNDNVESVFLSIEGIKIGDQTIETFEPMSFDLLKYRNGQTKVLLNTDLEAGSYNNITLILSNGNADVDGVDAGCHIVDKDGKIHPLMTNTINLTISSPFEIVQGETTTILIDFDLRKNIQYTGNPDDAYEFSDNFNGGIRVLNKEETGTITGNASSAFNGSDKVIVYAYAKGTYDRTTEADASLEPQNQFAKAITSAAIQSNGDFSLHFLSPGNYEIHFASYDKQADGSYKLIGTLQFDVLGEISADDISVDTGNNSEVNVSVTGILFL